MGKIRELPRDLINIIAAGEVVERPASVLKELLENSIDAESSFIKINIEDFGQKLIEVSDDGIGMDQEDLIKSLQQHATSKISTKSDLEKISSYGFRGEALASISSVSEVTEVESKTEKVDSAKIVYKSGETNLLNSSRSDRGTKVSVYGLFNNIPARKKFLKSSNTELRNLINTFIDISLINIHIHFEFYHNNKLIHRLPKCNSIKERVFSIWKDGAQNLFEEYTISFPKYKLSLLIEIPDRARKNAQFQLIYVNRRRIENKIIASAIKEAYSGFIHKELKPSYIILIDVEPSEVDVNVHPRKLEVRFQNSQEIFRTVFSAVRKKLEINTKNSIIDSIRETQTDYSAQSSEFSYSNPNKTFTIPKYTPRLGDKVSDSISFSAEIINSSQEFREEIKNNDNLGTLSQYFNTYIVYEKDSELVFIDQHAAAEKINFEKLLDEFGSVRTKPLLIPTVIDLNKNDKEVVLSKKDNLSEIGIFIEDFGGDSISLTEIPEIIEEIDFLNYIEDLLQDKNDYSWLKREYSEYSISEESYALLAKTACHGSIRAGQKLSPTEMNNLVLKLKELKQPNNCPHGRPILWKISKQEIEKNFKRII